MPILTQDDYPAVRAALHTELNEDHLSDSVIAMDIYSGRAELEILSRDPDAATRTGSEATHIKNAAIFFLASYLAPAIEMVTSESIPGGGYRYTRPEVKWDVKAEMLRAAAEEELADVLDDGVSTRHRPTMFAVAAGRRGR